MITAYKTGGTEDILVSEMKWKPVAGDFIHTREDGIFIVEKVVIFVDKKNNLGKRSQTISVWCKEAKYREAYTPKES